MPTLSNAVLCRLEIPKYLLKWVKLAQAEDLTNNAVLLPIPKLALLLLRAIESCSVDNLLCLH